MWVTTAMGRGARVTRRCYDASSNSGRLYSPARLVRDGGARLGRLRRERRDQVGEPRERAGANADQAQAARQVDPLQARPAARRIARASSVCAGKVRSRVAIRKSSKRSLMPIVFAAYDLRARSPASCSHSR